VTDPNRDRDVLSETPWLDPGAEPFVQLTGLSKRFGDFTAVDRVDLSIFQGELFSILGASGCGKTTLLRMLAGLEEPSEGTIRIDGVDVTDLPPYERPVNIMFQSYALFPHMTVEQNVAYGLKKEGVPAPRIRERVAEILELVQLQAFARARPRQISGGQSQRVALARALIKRPKVLLLDEPLAALDKKLREHTQFELANVQDRLGVTFIVVTHDQEEAMTLSTRIAVMDEGRFVQIGTPGEIYEHPRNRFVADFVGKINLLEGVVESVADGVAQVHCGEIRARLAVPYEGGLSEGARVCVAVRPENVASRVSVWSSQDAGSSITLICPGSAAASTPPSGRTTRHDSHSCSSPASAIMRRTVESSPAAMRASADLASMAPTASAF